MHIHHWIMGSGVALVLAACSTDGWVTPPARSNMAISPDVRKCPDWSSNPVYNYSNEDFSNLGCSTTHNLYVHLRDKNDYKRGSGKPAINPERDSAVMENYFKGTAPAGASSGDAASASSTSR